MPTRTFPGRFASLAPLGKYVSGLAAAAGLDEAAAYAVQLAVDEAATNIIEHAYGGEDRGEIEFLWHAEDDQVQIILKDTGSAFEPEKVPTPPVGVPLAEYGPRGAGLLRMNKLMDEVRFDFQDGVNVLTMVKRKKKAA
jgi:serine/threonine-protein kinase RsbW